MGTLFALIALGAACGAVALTEKHLDEQEQQEKEQEKPKVLRQEKDSRKCGSCGRWYKEYVTSIYETPCKCSFSYEVNKGSFSYRTMFE